MRSIWVLIVLMSGLSLSAGQVKTEVEGPDLRGLIPTFLQTHADKAQATDEIVANLISDYELSSEAAQDLKTVLASLLLSTRALEARGMSSAQSLAMLEADANMDIALIFAGKGAPTPTSPQSLLSDCEDAVDLLDQAMALIDATMSAIGNPGCDISATDAWYKLQSARVNLPNLQSELSGDPRPCTYSSKKSRFDYAKKKAAQACSSVYYSTCLSSGIYGDCQQIANLINNAANAASNCCDGTY